MNVSIYTRTKNHANQWRYHRVHTGRGKKTGDLAPPFYLRHTLGGKQRFTMLDGANTFEAAKEAGEMLQTALEAESKGLTVAELDDLRLRERISQKVTEYLKYVTEHKRPRSARAFDNSLHKYFVPFCKKTYVADIIGSDVLAFKKYLEDSKTLGERSIYNNFLNVMIFLKWAGVKHGVKKADWPDKTEREPEAYTSKEIDMLLIAANSEERLLLKSFLMTGFRSGEMEHLTYADIDFHHSIWKVQAKKDWKPKTKDSQRGVPVHSELTQKIRERMKTGNRGKVDLIFPNTLGNSNGHMERIVQRVAKRAGVEGRVDDHKFRSTAITLWLRDGCTIPDVMKWVGHKTPQTIMRYAAKLELENAANRAKITNPFNPYMAIGD